MPLNKTYITHPQRIYHNPLAPATSDYDEVIPVTTSDAVIMEGTTIPLTNYLKEYLVSGTDQRNSTITGTDIVKQDASGVQVGNLIVTIASGFTDKGKADDTLIDKPAYTTLPTPTSNDNFIILKVDGNFEYVTNFDGGRSFPQNPNAGDIYFNDQLRQAYKYNAGSPGTWEPYPCVAIARFESGILAEILPFNTWWWDEILYDSLETDIPIGMELGIISDNGDLLKINPGSFVDNNIIYKIQTPFLKNIAQPFVAGSGNGSADGSYTVAVTNLISTDISPTNTYGFILSSTSNDWYNCFNPALNSANPGVQFSNTPSFGIITLPGTDTACIKKYSVTSYAQNDNIERICNEWKLYGSNDGDNWDLIHYVASSGFTDVNQTKSWITNNGQEYHYFKFVFLGNVGNNRSYTSIGQIRLFYGSPRIKVFAISNGISTDILTSKNENPLLPAGYNSFKQLGSVTITANDTVTLDDVYPLKDLSDAFVTGFPALTDKINKRVSVDFDNISKSGLNTLSNLVMPQYGRTDFKTLSSGVVYQAAVPGYVWVSVFYTSSDCGIFGSMNISDISGSSTPANKALWKLYDGDGVGRNTFGATVVPIPKGMYYKYVADSTNVAVFIPTVGYQYNN